MGRLILIAVRNLMKQKRRTFLLGGAIVLVTMLLVVLVGISRGMQDTMLKSATTLLSGHINVAGFFKVTSNAASPTVTQFEQVREVVEKAVPDIDYVIDRVRGWGKVISEQSSLQVPFSGVDIANEAGLRRILKIQPGGDLEGLNEPNTALIFAKQAERLEVDVGDRLTLSAPTIRGVNNSVDVRVVAIANDVGFMSQFFIYVPNQTLRDLYQVSDDATGAIMIYLNEARSVSLLMPRVRSVLEEAGYRVMEHEAQPFWAKFETVNREDWTGQKIDVTTWEDEMAFTAWTVVAFDVISMVLLSVLLVIIVIGIMNTMFMAIRERIREVGTLRAIGMYRRQVLTMFMVEALVLSVSATALGAALGTGLALGLDAANISIGNEALQLVIGSDRLSLALDAGSILRSMAIIVMVTTTFALFPSWRAARMKPVTAIRHAG